MNAWSHLPNAAHIDRVVKSVKSHPEIWYAAWSAGRVAAWSAGRVAAWEEAWYAAWSAGRVAARDSARDAIAALVAWDDSAEFLDMTGDELEVWARLSEDPRAILLLPMKWVQEYEQQSMVTPA